MEAREKALNLITEVLELKDIILTPETFIKDVPEWDSLAQLQIVGEIEENFHVTIPIEAIIDMKTVGDLLKYLD
jgi:acyl carrier protein